MAGKRPARPPFIVSAKDVPETTHVYPTTDEPMAPKRAIGRAAGLMSLGLHLVRVPPGHRTSLPHAESLEEEFAFVVSGELDCWIDGHLHHMVPGDLVAWPAGTGIAHTLLNNGTEDAVLFAGGEGNKNENKILYPVDTFRKASLRWNDWWDDAPKRELGPHDGKPDAVRKKAKARKPA